MKTLSELLSFIPQTEIKDMGKLTVLEHTLEKIGCELKVMGSYYVVENQIFGGEEFTHIYNSIDTALISCLEVVKLLEPCEDYDDEEENKEIIKYIENIKNIYEQKEEILECMTENAGFGLYITNSYIICDGRSVGYSIDIYKDIDKALIDWLPTFEEIEKDYGQEHLEEYGVPLWRNEIDFIKNNCR